MSEQRIRVAVDTARWARIEAVATRRACGGWLCVSVPEAPLRIGVTADTEASVTSEYERAVYRWERLVDEYYAAASSPRGTET